MSDRGMLRDRAGRSLLVASRTDPNAFAAFYDAHVDALLRHVVPRCRDLDSALDVLSETFAKALERPLVGWGGWGRSKIYDPSGKAIGLVSKLFIPVAKYDD